MDLEHLKCIKKKVKFKCLIHVFCFGIKKLNASITYRLILERKKKKKELESRYKKNLKKIEQMNNGKNI